MRIKEVYDRDLSLTFEKVARDRELISNIQIRLKSFGYSVGKADGLYVLQRLML